jgi:gliding motility-associated-like protein
MVNPIDSVSLFFTYERPSQGIHYLGFNVICPSDNNIDNNVAFKELQVIGEVGQLALSPQIFSPNNDGVDDRLQIDYRLPEIGGDLTISIYDTRGKLIHYIIKGEPCSVSNGTVYWDGSVPGKKIPTGMYIVYLEYRYHNKITQAKKTTVLAR